MKTVIDLNSQQAKDFFMLPESYCTFDLPSYFDFEPILKLADNIIAQKSDINNCIAKSSQNNKPYKISNFDNVNNIITINKDGKYSWRTVELIHPLLYANLVSIITESNHWNHIISTLNLNRKAKRIRCVSIPVVNSPARRKNTASQILNWWERFEQESFKQALKYDHIHVTDISNCYASIYTHSIDWAMHTKAAAKQAKQNSQKTGIGGRIDNCIQQMRYGQTNGIPQGSLLMDFIAEIVLSHIDQQLFSAINKHKIRQRNYLILRYRDDYRIFTKTASEGKSILKLLNDILKEFGLSLNPYKTATSQDLILSAIKKDKFSLLTSQLANWTSKHDITNSEKNKYQSKLLQIYDFALKNPNSGQLKKLLATFYCILPNKLSKTNQEVLISILVNLAYNNPGIYPQTVSILSRILATSTKKDKLRTVKLIKDRFGSIPNTSFMDIWLQRLSATLDISVHYSTPLCQLLSNAACNNSIIWNNLWMEASIKARFETCKIVDNIKLQNLQFVICQKEFDAFKPQYDDCELHISASSTG